MDETHRFLRYVMPGASFSIESLLLLLILWPDWIVELLKEFVKEADWGSALVAFLGLGGIGFLFSIFHHCSLKLRFLGNIDYRPVILRLRERNILKLIEAGTGELLPINEPENRDQAWVILNAVWHQRASSNLRIRGADQRAQTLSDMVHSIGTARIGALFTIAMPFLVYYAAKDLSVDILRILLAIVIAGAILGIHCYAYKRISRIAENFISEVLEDTLTQTFWESGMPVTTIVDLRM